MKLLRSLTDQYTQRRVRVRVLSVATVIGIACTRVAVAVHIYAFEEFRTRVPGTILLWPAWALQAALPCFDMGTPENPMCEGTPIHLFAFLFGLVLTAGFYALLYRTILWARRYRS